GKVLRLLVDDEPFDVRYGRLLGHERVLDFRAGVLRRAAEWCSPAGRSVRVTSTRLVSFTRRPILAIAYAVEPLDARGNVVVQSELIANEAIPHVAGDPRTAAASESPLVSEEHLARDTTAMLIHKTRRSGLRVAAAMDHSIRGSTALRLVAQSWPDAARVV